MSVPPPAGRSLGVVAARCTIAGHRSGRACSRARSTTDRSPSVIARLPRLLGVGIMSSRVVIVRVWFDGPVCGGTGCRIRSGGGVRGITSIPGDGTIGGTGAGAWWCQRTPGNGSAPGPVRRWGARATQNPIEPEKRRGGRRGASCRSVAGAGVGRRREPPTRQTWPSEGRGKSDRSIRRPVHRCRSAGTSGPVRSRELRTSVP